MFTDTDIQEAVRAALDSDRRIKHPELIAVSVDEIGTVVLRGAVGTLPERLAAAHDARHVEGVFNVIVDDVKVHPPVGPRRSDDEIRAAAIETLTADPRIRSIARARIDASTTASRPAGVPSTPTPSRWGAGAGVVPCSARPLEVSGMFRSSVPIAYHE
jgi:osmotically-inducible protein OsmY